MWIWTFIGFVALVAIIFGISLHSAFWWIVGVIATICAIGWAVGTESGKKFMKWCAIIIGMIVGGVLVYQGIVDKTGDEKKYESDVQLCETTLKGYYLDHSTNQYHSYAQDCIDQAGRESKSRNDRWWVEVVAGIIIFSLALGIKGVDDKKSGKSKEAKPTKKRTNPNR